MKIYCNLTSRLLLLLAVSSVVAMGCQREKPHTEQTESGGITVSENKEGYSFEKLPDVVATVNGTDIPKIELKKIYTIMSAQLKMTQQEVSEEKLIYSALDELISAELLKQESKKQNITPSPEAVEKELETLRAQFPDTESFENALREKGFTIKDVRKNIEDQLVLKEVLEREIDSKIAVSEKAVKDFYAENRDYFKKEESVRASHILVKSEENDNEKKVAEARKKIDNILALVKKGDDFGEAAKKYSEGPSASSGGDLGYFTRGQMVKPFEDAAFSLKTGEISDVVKTRFGFHIIKLVDRKEKGVAPLEEVRESIKSYLTRLEGEKHFARYIESLRSSASIEKKI